MANYAPRSLRAVQSRDIRFSLAHFERALTECLGESHRDRPGTPCGRDPVLSAGPKQALTSYLLGEFLSKFDDGADNPLKQETTWERFHAAERLCFETNQRLQANGFKGPHERVILRARELASNILGRFDWDAAAKDFGWGPGASTRCTRRRSDAAYKYSGTPDTTYGNAALADAAIRSVYLWKSELDKLGPQDSGYCKVVPGNRIVTVPKNYKTDRTIAIEPCMNMYVQKGIGGLMRKRLRLAGCDLNDQSRNQRLARVGAISGRLATIDLSMASDTVSRVLVSKFIRTDWLEALEQSRSQFGILPSGEKIFYQKFSSMGNGFTFELESVIFYSLALAVTEACGEEVCRVSVYGDDIVVPSAAAGLLEGVLEAVGFKANVKKSFSAGPFRESCGKHYFLEHDITPFYVRGPVDKLTDLFLLHNNLFRWQQRVRDFAGFESLDSLLKKLRGMASAKWRKPRIPDGFGDGAFVGDLNVLQLAPHRHGWEYWVVNVLSQCSDAQFDCDLPGLLLKSLSDLEKIHPDTIRVSREIYPLRVGRVKQRKLLIPQYALVSEIARSL